MSQEDVDRLKKVVNDGFSRVQQTVNETENEFQSRAAELSTNVRKGLSYSLNRAAAFQSRAKDAMNTADAHYQSTEAEVLENVRGNVKTAAKWCMDYPYAAYAGVFLGVCLLPGPRAFLSRNVFGVFQSQESAFRSATESYTNASARAQELLKGKDTSVASANTAIAALRDARTAAGGASAELRSQAAKLAAASNEYERILDVLRPLRHKDVYKLTSDVARDQREVQAAQKEMERLAARLVDPSA